ncbi:hypothetical protein MPTK1_3g24850 [Marchantia polymorpha subsp. ruderalis]|uniref:Uncharacterized protein n=2 Tax=Marchantia polymorpha TaxID=3197 RepID=A0AAF6B4H3_MARPO|nr:hypothetical protein MARPO_0183s0017 [Marchantia polymorpha]BBN06907.1 hypothetical protein Mp_3g24850 [Marchantia polymorpha subsp. ruderalis]|eukprot:PTQ27812.1 hypothetical protein MARPO_0183s0017 [Marchantia polymorpha]
MFVVLPPPPTILDPQTNSVPPNERPIAILTCPRPSPPLPFHNIAAPPRQPRGPPPTEPAQPPLTGPRKRRVRQLEIRNSVENSPHRTNHSRSRPPEVAGSKYN